MVMHRFDKIVKNYRIKDITIKSKNSLKVLGIKFNQNLNWNDHVMYSINSCQKILHGLKILRKYFTKDSFSQVMTSFLFTKLFYAIKIWPYHLLSFECKRKLDSFYFNCCRIIVKDYDRTMSRNSINIMIKRATPMEYSNYCTARTVIKNMSNVNSPLFEICKSNSYQTQRKPGQYFFFDNSRNKIGKNSINNRITEQFKSINFQWLNMSENQIRINLKKTFFEYFK